MQTELRKAALRAACRARARLRDQGVEWNRDAGAGNDSDVRFSDDGAAIRWLEEQCRSGEEAENTTRAALSRIALDAARQVHARVNELPGEAFGTDLGVRLDYLLIPYQGKTHQHAGFTVTTRAARCLYEEAERVASRYGLNRGQATALIMTGRLPEMRGRSRDDIVLDNVLKEVLREMKEEGLVVPPPGLPGVRSGVAVYWKEAQTRFNAIIADFPELKNGRADAINWRTTRSRYKALCEREPEFCKEMEG